MHLLITRPEPEASALQARLAALGIGSTLEPLLVIQLTPPVSLDLDGVQALIATSRNGLRGLAASPGLAAAMRSAIVTVGPDTAEFARAIGFQSVIAGPASARDLVPLIMQRLRPGDGRLLHLCGDKVAFDLEAALKPAGFQVGRQTVYRSQPASVLGAATIAALVDGTIDTVLLTSPLAARTFVSLACKAQIIETCQRLVYVCLSQNVAECLRPINPVTVQVARAPNSQSTLALIETLARAAAHGSFP